MRKRNVLDIKLVVTLDEDCEDVDLGDIFIRAKGEMQNALNDEFPNGLGLPHVEIEEK